MGHGTDLVFILRKAVDPVSIFSMEAGCACILVSTGCTVHIKNEESTASILEDTKEHVFLCFSSFLDFFVVQ